VALNLIGRLLNGLFSTVERSPRGADQQAKEVLDFARFSARSVLTPSDRFNKSSRPEIWAPYHWWVFPGSSPEPSRGLSTLQRYKSERYQLDLACHWRGLLV